jgi:hypothetical protein
MEFRDYKNLTDEEKQFWQFEQLSCISPLKVKVDKIEWKINTIYIYVGAVTATITFGWMLIKDWLFKKF